MINHVLPKVKYLKKNVEFQIYFPYQKNALQVNEVYFKK